MTAVQWLKGPKDLAADYRIWRPAVLKPKLRQGEWDLDEAVKPLLEKDPATWVIPANSEIFGEDRSHYAIGGLFGIMAAAPQHTYFVHTANPVYVEEFIAGFGERHLRVKHGEFVDRVHLHELAKGLLGYWHPNRTAVHDGPWPLPNVWFVDLSGTGWREVTWQDFTKEELLGFQSFAEDLHNSRTILEDLQGVLIAIEEAWNSAQGSSDADAWGRLDTIIKAGGKVARGESTC